MVEAAEVALRRGGRCRPPGLAWTLDNGPLLLLLDPGYITVIDFPCLSEREPVTKKHKKPMLQGDH